MATLATPVACPGDIAATVLYGRPAATVPAFGGAEPNARTVLCRDMRGADAASTLAEEGFALVRHRTSVTDFDDAGAIAATYLPEVRDAIRSATGAAEVFMQQNWVLRAETREMGATQLPGGQQAMTMKTGGFVHLDYDDAAAEAWAQYTLDRHGETERPDGRLLVITAWRALSPAPQDKPLALIDRRTVSTSSYIREEIRSPLMTWNGYQLAHDPAHRFCWWSDLTADELILFLQYEEGYGPGSGAPHTAFDHPGCIGVVPPRQSIEVRAYAFVRD